MLRYAELAIVVLDGDSHEYYNIRLDILHDSTVNYLPELIEHLGGIGRGA